MIYRGAKDMWNSKEPEDYCRSLCTAEKKNKDFSDAHSLFIP